MERGKGFEDSPEIKSSANAELTAKSKTAGLDRLRTKLLNDVTRFQRHIEEAIREDNTPPRTGWEKLAHAVGKVLDGGSRESIAKRQWGPRIERAREVINAIDQGDTTKAVKYLIHSINGAIVLVGRGLLVTEDRSSGNSLVEIAKGEIALLRYIDPEQAGRLERKLNAKTGNPLRKF